MQEQIRFDRIAQYLAAGLCSLWLMSSAAQAEPQYQTVIAPDGVPLAVTTDGPADAPAILFIHGLAQSSLSWSAQFDSDLAKTYHLVAFDLRGHGASGKPWAEGSYSEKAWASDIAAIIAATGIKRPLVVAWSYGTYVINDYVRLNGKDNLAGIVYIGATGGLAAPSMASIKPDAIATFNKVRESQMSPDLNKQIEGARLSGTYLFHAPVSDEIKERSFDASLMLPGYARSVLYARHMDSQGAESQLKDLPLLFLGGREDGAYAGDVSDRLKKLLPQSQVILYDGVGHSPFLEAPDRFNTDLGAFAATIFSPAKRSKTKKHH